MPVRFGISGEAASCVSTGPTPGPQTPSAGWDPCSHGFSRLGRSNVNAAIPEIDRCQASQLPIAGFGSKCLRTAFLVVSVETLTFSNTSTAQALADHSPLRVTDQRVRLGLNKLTPHAANPTHEKSYMTVRIMRMLLGIPSHVFPLPIAKAIPKDLKAACICPM